MTDSSNGTEHDGRKKEFARRLQRELLKRGWSQAELARRASLFMPDETPLERTNINGYVRAKSLPDVVRLNAISRAFEVLPFDLLSGHVDSVPGPSLESQMLPDGNILFRANITVNQEAHLKLLQVIHEYNRRDQ